MEIHKALRNIRKSKGFSQEEVADRLGVDTTNYGRIERGQASITLERLMQLAELYGMSVVELVAIITGNSENTKVSSINEHDILLENLNYLKSEVIFLRESLRFKDEQLSRLIEMKKKNSV
jgi:transcriptional regulator with XRE-family HTH domain